MATAARPRPEIQTHELPGEGRALGLWRAHDEAELREIMASLPLCPWLASRPRRWRDTPVTRFQERSEARETRRAHGPGWRTRAVHGRKPTGQGATVEA